MNKLILNIAINFYHETKTSEQIADELKEFGLLYTIRKCLLNNPNAISVAAFDEEVEDCLYGLYNNPKLNLWAEENE